MFNCLFRPLAKVKVLAKAAPRLAFAITCGIAASASSVRADVAVNNYNWLQLPSTQATASFGSTTGTGGSGYGTPAEMRWGNHVWIPDGTVTNNGAADYWGIINLDQARNVSQVSVQLWAGEGTSASKFHIDGSTNNGTSWTPDIGTFTGAITSPRTGPVGANAVPVTSGNYTNIRVRFDAGEYTFGNGSRGGPGIYAIEPIGSGTLPESQVNWANQPTFGTTVSTNGLGFGSTRFNDGFFYDDEGARTGNNPGNWDPGDYAQINLGASRPVNRAVIVWDNNGWSGQNFNVQYSTDGTNFQSVLNPTLPVLLNGNDGGAGDGATQVSFDAVNAVAFRIIDVTGPEGYHLINQVELLGAPVPEPTGIALLAVVGCLSLRRRRTS